MYFVQCPYIFLTNLFTFSHCVTRGRDSWILFLVDRADNIDPTDPMDHCISHVYLIISIILYLMCIWSYRSFYISCVFDHTDHFISHVYLIIPIILYLICIWSYRSFYICHMSSIHFIVDHVPIPDLPDHNADHFSLIIDHPDHFSLSPS